MLARVLFEGQPDDFDRTSFDENIYLHIKLHINVVVFIQLLYELYIISTKK